MATDLTTEARQGYDDERYGSDWVLCPYLSTSDSASVWMIGRWLKRNNQQPPIGVRASRGSTYHVRSRKVKVTWNGAAKNPTVMWV